MTSLFLSDIHLLDSDAPKTTAFIRFLKEEAVKHHQIFILGDLFDVWPGTTQYLIKRFAPVLNVLKELVNGGAQIFYIEGNHDFLLGEYFKKELGIEVFHKEIIKEFNGKKTYLSHGDLGNPKDIKYKILRKLLRLRILHLAAKVIPSSWIFKLGAKSSKASRDWQVKKPRNTMLIQEIYRENAKQYFNKGYDVVIMGHTHIPDDHHVQMGARTCRYINTGDWLINFTYLEFDGKEFYTKTNPIKGS